MTLTAESRKECKMAKTNIMICGASGFIGRNLFEYFSSKEGFETFGTYYQNKPKIFNPRLVQADLRQKDQASWVTQDMNIVINCAAMTDGIGAYFGKEKVFKDNNDLINKNLIKSAYENNVRNFIYLSCTVMYHSSLTPLKENEYDPSKTDSKYSLLAQMKIFGEENCRKFASKGKTKYTAVRHSNIYGPYDKFDLKRGHVLAATITKAVGTKEDTISVWGKGTESRDFLYIDDLIDFIDKAIERQKNNFEIFNVGYGQTCSINDLVDKIIFASGKKIKVTHDLNKPSIETHMNIDVDKAKKVLDWKAKIDLSRGLRKTIDWYGRNRI